MTTSLEACPSALRLDRLLSKELSLREEQALLEHVETCERCRPRVQALREDWARFANEARWAPTPPSNDAVHTRLSGGRSPTRLPAHIGRWLFSGSGVLAAAAALVLWLFSGNSLLPKEVQMVATDEARETPLRPRGDDPQGPLGSAPARTGALATPELAASQGVEGSPRDPSAPSPTPSSSGAADTRKKGPGALLRYFVRRDGQLLGAGEPSELRPGDGLRFGLQLGRPAHCGVFGVEATGKVSAYFQGANLERLPAGSPSLMSGAVELDDSSGDEHLVAVCCERAQSSAQVLSAVQARWSAPALPDGCSFELRRITKVAN